MFDDYVSLIRNTLCIPLTLSVVYCSILNLHFIVHIILFEVWSVYLNRINIVSTSSGRLSIDV